MSTDEKHKAERSRKMMELHDANYHVFVIESRYSEVVLFQGNTELRWTDHTNVDASINTAYAHLQREQQRVAFEKFVLEASNDNSHLYDFYFDVESDLITIREKAQKLVAQYNITDDDDESGET